MPVLLFRLLLSVLALALTFPVPFLLFESLGNPPWVAALFSTITITGLLAPALVLRFTHSIRRIPAAWSKPLLLILSILAPLVLLEWGCRAVSSPTWSEASHWRWYALEVKRNEAGLRGASVSWLNDPKVRPVVILGDSFAFGYKVRQEETFPALLDSRHSSRSMRVVNASHPNWSIKEQQDFFTRNKGALREPLVIVAHVLNDIAPASNRPDPVSVRFSVWLYYHVYASRLVRPVMDAWAHRSFGSRLESAYDPANPGWNDYFSRLESLQKDISDSGGKLAFVLFPWFVELQAYPFDRVHQRLRQEVVKRGISFLDLLPMYQMHDSRDLIVSRTDLHPNGEAHRLAADSIERFIPVVENDKLRRAQSMKPFFRVLHITDTHLFSTDTATMYGVPTGDSLTQIVDQALRAIPAPDLILATGDLTQDETAESYQRLIKIVGDRGVPVHCLPGNHDDLGLMRDAFSGAPVRWSLQLMAGGWQVLLLNSVVVGKVGGRFSDDELARLEKSLAAHPDTPALVALHHHPVPVGAPWMDNIMLEEAEKFFSVLQKARQKITVLCGHVHQEMDTAQDGIRVLATPSTSVQFKPREPNFTLDTKSPGFRFLDLYPDGRLETSVHRLPAGSFPADPALKGY